MGLPDGVDTYHASAERVGPAAIRKARAAFLADPLHGIFLEAIPDLAVVLNAQRQLIAANTRFLEAMGLSSVEPLLGLRPGEAIGCAHAEESPGGCGTGLFCITCGAVNAILECLGSRQPVRHECRICTKSREDGGARDLHVQATYLPLEEMPLIVLAMRDISCEKRRGVLERVFFHDVLNTAASLVAMAEFLVHCDPDRETDIHYKRSMLELSRQLCDEIAAHRQLLSAEKGDLEVRTQEVRLHGVLDDLVASYRGHEVGQGRQIEVRVPPGSTVHTDLTLLRRILGNLVKNALEATPEGGIVTVAVASTAGEVAISVNNPGVMPEEVQRQVFQRSFSTKTGPGHGIGTYSIRLFVEQYLGGRVGFASGDPAGTTFTVTLPRTGPKGTNR